MWEASLTTIALTSMFIAVINRFPMLQLPRAPTHFALTCALELAGELVTVEIRSLSRELREATRASLLSGGYHSCR